MFITIKWRVLTVLFNISVSLMFFYVTVLWFLESWVLKSSTIYMPCQCLYLLSVLSVFASCILNSQFLVACTFRIIIFAWVYLTFFFFFMKFGMLLAIICSIFFLFPLLPFRNCSTSHCGSVPWFKAFSFSVYG